MSTWLTHPNLTPAHDFKCEDAAIGTWMGSGWEVRADQSDPVEQLPAEPEPALPALSESDRQRVTEPVIRDNVIVDESSANDEPATPDKTSRKKGS